VPRLALRALRLKAIASFRELWTPPPGYRISQAAHDALHKIDQKPK
jgi:hypothetical protein